MKNSKVEYFKSSSILCYKLIFEMSKLTTMDPPYLPVPSMLKREGENWFYCQSFGQITNFGINLYLKCILTFRKDNKKLG